MNGGLYANLYHEQFDSGRVECHCLDGIVLVNGRVVPQREGVAVRA